MIRKASWQWQLVLIMMLVSGIALSSFIVVSYQLVRISNYKKLDAELVAYSLKYAWPYMISLRPDRPDPERISAEERLVRLEGRGFAFYHLGTGASHADPAWPEELDPEKLGRSIPGLYARQGKTIPRTRMFDSQPRLPVDRQQRQLDRRPGRPPRQQLPSLEQAVFESVQTGDKQWRVLGFTNGEGVFMAVKDLAQLKEEMGYFRQAILMALPVVLLLIGLVAWYLAGRAVGPVKRLTNSAAGITAEGLDARLAPEGEPPEFARLIEVYNQMLDRLERSFLQARRFSADAAHELNTPLTILQGHLDVLLQSVEQGSGQQEQVALLLEETRGLEAVIRKLLLLSQADSGSLLLEPVEFDLSQFMEDLLEDAQVMAPGLTFTSEIAPGIRIKGDRDLLRQCVYNLLSNAIKYNRKEGFVQVGLMSQKGQILLEIANSGVQVPPEQAGRLFDRFFRVDAARNRRTEGRGLGLSLAREFARAHGGDIELVANETDRIVFRLSLPALNSGGD